MYRRNDGRRSFLIILSGWMLKVGKRLPCLLIRQITKDIGSNAGKIETTEPCRGIRADDQSIAAWNNEMENVGEKLPSEEIGAH